MLIIFSTTDSLHHCEMSKILYYAVKDDFCIKLWKHFWHRDDDRF